MTPAEDMKLAYELGSYINLDDATMVDFLERVAGVPKTVFCRYNPGGTFELSDSEEGFQVMDNPGEAKYGMTEAQMVDSFRRLKAKGAKYFGIHAFLASNTISNEYYPELAGILFQLAVRVAKAADVKITCINLSGGVGIPYRPEQPENDIFAIGEGVHKKFDEILAPAGMGDVKIFTEMGRFTTGPYGALIATAIHEKHIYKEYIGLDACAANLMRPAMYGAYHHVTVLGKQYAPHDHKYERLWAACAKTTTSLPLTACCRKSTSAISSTSTIPARTVPPWATTTTANCAAPRCCCARTAAIGSSAVRKRRRIILPRWTRPLGGICSTAKSKTRRRPASSFRADAGLFFCQAYRPPSN